VKLSVAVRVPVAVGLNTIVAVQLEPAARLVLQVLLDRLKSAMFAPEMAMLLMVIEVVSPLCNCAD